MIATAGQSDIPVWHYHNQGADEPDHNDLSLNRSRKIGLRVNFEKDSRTLANWRRSVVQRTNRQCSLTVLFRNLSPPFKSVCVWTANQTWICVRALTYAYLHTVCLCFSLCPQEGGGLHVDRHDFFPFRIQGGQRALTLRALQNSEWGPLGPTSWIGMGPLGILGAHFEEWAPKWALLSWFGLQLGVKKK